MESAVWYSGMTHPVVCFMNWARPGLISIRGAGNAIKDETFFSKLTALRILLLSLSREDDIF